MVEIKLQAWMKAEQLLRAAEQLAGPFCSSTQKWFLYEILSAAAASAFCKIFYLFLIAACRQFRFRSQPSPEQDIGSAGANLFGDYPLPKALHQ